MKREQREQMVWRAGSDWVQLAHGEGGLFTHLLESQLFVPSFSNPILSQLGDAAWVGLSAAADACTAADTNADADADIAQVPANSATAVALTTDTFVVSPVEFPGGDLGKLAVCGTLNDLAVAGARPVALTVGFVLEEGLPFATLERIVDSLARTARQAGVPVVAGDTKVVRRGEADQLYINTTGLGVWRGCTRALPGYGDGQAPTRLRPELRSASEYVPNASRIEVGDVLLVSGDIGRHGVAILASRAGVGFTTEVESDVAWIGPEVEALVNEVGWPAVHALRDVTRGGLATVVKELTLAAATPTPPSESRRLMVLLEQEAIPVDPTVAAAAEWLGLDPLYLPCEGRWVAVVHPAAADSALTVLRRFHTNAAVVGVVTEAASLLRPVGAVAAGTTAGTAGTAAAAATAATTTSTTTPATASATATAMAAATATGPAGTRRGGRGQAGEVWLRTPLGSHRRLDLLAGEPQPRIC